MRSPPEPLYSEVFDLATAITNASEAEDGEGQARALQALRDFYRARSVRGEHDPFLTETLADYESEPTTRAQLYRLALEQSALFADEPVYTKKIGLAGCLIEIGEFDEARNLLEHARPLAVDANDEWQLKEADELLSRVTPKRDR